MLIDNNRPSKTTSTSRIKALMPSTRSACGPVLQPWCSCFSACSSSSSPASVRGRRRSRVLAGTVTRRMLIVAWAMMGMRLRGLRGGRGGTGGSDYGEG